ncbi:TetR/AcrR family transcriptional regulator [Mycobacteroides abscessus]|nr:TetR/AcrR family transcriptional regulator [Mycobacteroides abscessus]PVA53163.1 TetR/AcrR family transcriptional regulator [Mycobacteroides abscessus]RIQ94081.1 TetR/AcrR family transcriptional regulator [Mycobacteroides abscessus]RIQ95497.1 TetR/AcrR family transcriptional regulator [Mycobacteroides abscessus]RIR87247.1 TetR/AcrR family transcriptional regulator [Mycobacteroides abscessus]
MSNGGLKGSVAAPRADVGTRRRDDALMSAIRDATYAELQDHGYAGVTFEGVARRAKTSKPVLYRRYRSRARMVADALPTLRYPPTRLASATSLREDVLALLGALLRELHRIGVGNYRCLLAEADDGLADDMTTAIAGWVDQTVLRALADARERGEIGPEDIPLPVATSILALMRHELFFTRKPFGESKLAELFDTVYLPLINLTSRGGNAV